MWLKQILNVSSYTVFKLLFRPSSATEVWFPSTKMIPPFNRCHRCWRVAGARYFLLRLRLDVSSRPRTVTMIVLGWTIFLLKLCSVRRNRDQTSYLSYREHYPAHGLANVKPILSTVRLDLNNGTWFVAVKASYTFRWDPIYSNRTSFSELSMSETALWRQKSLFRVCLWRTRRKLYDNSFLKSPQS